LASSSDRESEQLACVPHQQQPTQPIAVEHSMYWNSGGTLWASGSNETGIKLP
jgi:hypothetical protein